MARSDRAHHSNLYRTIWSSTKLRHSFDKNCHTSSFFQLFFFLRHTNFIWSQTKNMCTVNRADALARHSFVPKRAHTQRDRNQSQNNRQLIMRCGDDEQFHIPFTADRPLLFFLFFCISFSLFIFVCRLFQLLHTHYFSCGANVLSLTSERRPDHEKGHL